MQLKEDMQAKQLEAEFKNEHNHSELNVKPMPNPADKVTDADLSDIFSGSNRDPANSIMTWQI